MIDNLHRELHFKLLIYSSKNKIIYWDFAGLPHLFFGTCCSLSPVCDNLLPTVAFCENFEVLSIPENLFAVFLALSIAIWH